MMVVNRFRAGAGFESRLGPVLGLLGGKEGFVDGEIGRNLDDPELWVLVTRWRDVGSYRRALGGMESKMLIVPLLSEAIDEPSAYASPELVGENLPRGG